MEGFRELLGDEDGEVRIFTLLVGITVAVDREQAIVILFDDEAIGFMQNVRIRSSKDLLK